MPTNKNASYRYRLIDECLSNRAKVWTIPKLIDYITTKLYEEFDIESGVSKRTLQSDFSVMRKDWPQGYAAPIVCRKGTVFYSDPDYSIQKTPIIEKDIQVLQEALSLLQQFTELPHFEELQQVATKLESRLSQTNASSYPIIQFEHNHHLKGIDWLRPLYRSIAKQQAIELTYQPFKEVTPRTLIVHPHLLKEYNNRWFLLALKEEGRVIWNFALDRILEFKMSTVPYIRSNTFDAATHFKHIIGVTIPEDKQIECIRLKVQVNRAPYLLTKPLHASQQQEDTLSDGSVILNLSLIPNFELKAMLLSFGADVEVLSPDSLRAEMGLIAQSTASYYA